MKDLIVNKTKDFDEQGNECFKAEIKSNKHLLCDGAKHCSHFFVLYKTEEELDEILSHFEEVSDVN